MRTACAMCANGDGNRFHLAREMYYGTRDEFTYLECVKCGTLQITEVPDLDKYYPKDYYSFRPQEEVGGAARTSFKEELVRRSSLDYYLNESSLLGKYLVRNRQWIRDWLAAEVPGYLKNTKCRLGVTSRAGVLDVGCGAGAGLLQLRRCGFTDLTGVDPFIASNITYANGVRVLKTDLSAVTGKFDLVIMDHVFEHVPDPRQTLRDVRRVLKPERYAIVRIPLASYAWQRYNINWVQLDAPRHLFVYTAGSLTALAEESGFAVDDVIYDSTAFQFWASEQYVNDIPLEDERSYLRDPGRSMFTAEQINDYSAQAAELNSRRQGDQATFYLRKR